MPPTCSGDKPMQRYTSMLVGRYATRQHFSLRSCPAQRCAGRAVRTSMLGLVSQKTFLGSHAAEIQNSCVYFCAYKIRDKFKKFLFFK